MWQRNSKQHQQNDQTSNLFSTQSSSASFNLQFPPPISRQRRSNSLTPPVAPPHHLEVVDRTNSANNSSRHKPRSFSVSGDHAGNSNTFHLSTILCCNCISFSRQQLLSLCRQSYWPRTAESAKLCEQRQ